MINAQIEHIKTLIKNETKNSLNPIYKSYINNDFETNQNTKLTFVTLKCFMKFNANYYSDIECHQFNKWVRHC